MVISDFAFEDKSLNWRLEQISLGNFTLLVGASGVGKTRILKALMSLKNIAEGASVNGIRWSIKFTTLSQRNYTWEGEFENKELSSFGYNDDKKDKPKIIYEKVFLGNELIISRDKDNIILFGKPTPKLAQEQSIIHLLKSEEKINPAYLGIRKLYCADYSGLAEQVQKLGSLSTQEIYEHLREQYNTATKIQESGLHTLLKLFLIQNTDKKLFSSIKQRFIDIFPKVEDLKIAPVEQMDKLTSSAFKGYPAVQIKEEGVKDWIRQNFISSGMLKTLLQLSELYLCPEGTVFLIDEFENSLGINCIDEIIRELLASSRRLQFVLTSHHPYIINAVDHNNWKLVTRNAGVVKTHNVDKFNIGKSKHDAFMQLIQLEEYQTGQE